MTIIDVLLNPYVLIPLIIWEVFWKGWGLWVAGNKKEKIWFVVLLLISTAGILGIYYLYTRKAFKRKK